MAMNYDEELEKTDVMKVKRVIEQSANSASVFPDEKDQSVPENTETIKEDNNDITEKENDHEENLEIPKSKKRQKKSK